MSDCLEIVVGDAFPTREEADLFEKLRVGGEVVASQSWNGGWGHHSVDAVVLFEGAYYYVSGGGCSCDGNASVSGPFATRASAGGEGLPAGDNYRDG